MSCLADFDVIRRYLTDTDEYLLAWRVDSDENAVYGSGDGSSRQGGLVEKEPLITDTESMKWDRLCVCELIPWEKDRGRMRL